MKMYLLFRFFFTPRGVLEMNRLEKIARRSKRLGGAIADLHMGQPLCFVHALEHWAPKCNSAGSREFAVTCRLHR